MMRFPPLMLFFLCPCLQAQTEGVDTPEVYDHWRNRVVQIQVIDQQAQTKAATGSGFFAGKPGWVLTNYHVIAGLANQPGQYRARYLSDNGQSGSLELLSVDAVHDLAVLRAENLAPSPLYLAAQAPPRGSRLYSMGYPYDIGLSIVEGTYNGMLEKSLYEKLHFTGSINPGMSGGPTLDHSGEVVGVNVSTAGNQVSFLVPAQFAAALINSTRDQPVGEGELNRSVTSQLLQNQEEISSRLLSVDIPTTQLNGYRVPAALAPYISCWGDSEEDQPNELARVYYDCQTQDDIFLADTLYTGVIRYQHDLLSTDQLHPLRFYRQLEEQSSYPQLHLEGEEKTVTNYRCHSDFVDHSEVTYKVSFCIRRYREFAGLYDSYLTLTSLVRNDEALQSTLVLGGFSWDNIKKLSARFIEAMSWSDPGS